MHRASAVTLYSEHNADRECRSFSLKSHNWHLWVSNPRDTVALVQTYRFRFELAGTRAVLLLAMCAAAALAQGERQYNGIRVPQEWPPRIPYNYEPMDPPYLKSPPEVIPIDVGRQLFVDDFLIERTDLQRTYHSARIHPASPVLRPDRAWEQEGDSPTAMPFSGGVFFDPRDRLFKMWYMCGYVRGLCYATSTDGLRWRKPQLDVRPGTNIVNPTEHDTSTGVARPERKGPAQAL